MPVSRARVVVVRRVTCGWAGSWKGKVLISKPGPWRGVAHPAYSLDPFQQAGLPCGHLLRASLVTCG